MDILKRIIVYSAIVCLFTQCAQSLKKFPSQEIIPKTKYHSITTHLGKDSINMLYLGCGHLIVCYKNECFTTDPFFSTQPFSKGKIKSSVTAFDLYSKTLQEQAIITNQINSVWLAHTHYDHMMDIPLLLKENLLDHNVEIYGNEFGGKILTNFITPEQYKTLGPDYQWITLSSSIRVMPIISDHAPHLKIGPVKFRMMKGELSEDYFRDNFTTAESVTKRKKWKEGNVYSFLIDFMDKGQITYRIFFQTSANNYPIGCPPKGMLSEHQVDAAVLCLASSNTVKPYPIEILKELKPTVTVFVHWEDFFLGPLEFENPKLVRATNFKKIFKRLDRADIEITKERNVMPRPGTMITFK